jgi:hypothetical protein
MDELIKKYISEGNSLFIIKDIVRYRDGGTIGIITSNEIFYIHKDTKEIYTKYEQTEEYLIKNETIKIYLLNRIDSFIKNMEFNLMNNKNLMKKLKEIHNL